MIRGLLLVAFLSLQSLALDMGDIEIMRDSGVKIAFPNESKAHTISRSTRPADLMRVNYIRLNGQSLRKIPKWLPKMRNLVKLELEATNMDLIDLFSLKSLSNLNTLNLNNNKNLFDKGGSLSELLSHFSLSELYLANTGGSSSDYANLGNSKSLIKLDLSDNAISSINALHLERLQNLKSLKIVGNRISGTLDTAYLPKRSLVYLNFSSNNISRLKYSDDFPALESLHISMNDSYLEFDEDWDDAYILKRLSKGSFNKDIALPKSIMKRLGIKSKKWMIPNNRICIKYGGKINEKTCNAEFSNAEKICNSLNGRLPTLKEFEVITILCKGLITKDDYSINKNKLFYSCIRDKGFTQSDYYQYWSSDIEVRYLGREDTPWGFNFNSGGYNHFTMGLFNFVGCISN